ncbi:DUF6156 family protein [Uliginosibacterium sediminicola]|uniref:DUF6156 family protein n=1 Tax=Uliginosibacterium sediminicola TaxID=2024550 RepID=A0ABU9Z1Y2_9RHOO
MSTTTASRERYFLSYSGIKLPLQLLEELPADALRNRNTWFRACYDEAGRMISCEKLVYGEVEMRHDYRWSAAGTLLEARIQGPDEDEDAQIIQFGESST